MRHLRWLAVGCVVCGAGSAQAFNDDDLRGLWAESNQNRYACTPTNRYQRFQLSADQKTLIVTIIRKSTSKPTEIVPLDIIKTDERSIYFRFPGKHLAPDPLAGEFAITIIGPGVYRWHMTSGHDTLKPAPIGIRCEP